MTGLYLLGRKRAERAAAHREADLIDRFECLNTQTNAEIRELRSAIERRDRIEDALTTERDETQQRWLH